MRTYAKGWRYFENPRSFGGEYGRQKGWERIPDNHLSGNQDGFQALTEAEAEQIEVVFQKTA